MFKDSIDYFTINIERYLRGIDYRIKMEARKIINELGITTPQFMALQILFNNGNLTIGELSQKMSLACSTITDLIDRMEKAHLVVREKSNKDKRVVIVSILPKGKDVLDKALDRRRAFIKAKLRDMSIEDIEKLNIYLENLHNEIAKE